MSLLPDRRQYLMHSAAGYTCLGFSLFVFLAEGAFVKSGWIAERTPNAFIGVGVAMLFLFPASLAYARMISRPSDPDPADLHCSRRLVARTVLLTIAVALIVETFAVGMEAIWHLSSPG